MTMRKYLPFDPRLTEHDAWCVTDDDSMAAATIYIWYLVQQRATKITCLHQIN